VPPHQYVVARRVERAQALLLRADRGLSLSEIATRAGFADQSHFCNHFKRLVGVTPRRFREAAGNSKSPQAGSRIATAGNSILGR
jgi:AraC-like DNA-binding protein